MRQKERARVQSAQWGTMRILTCLLLLLVVMVITLVDLRDAALNATCDNERRQCNLPGAMCYLGRCKCYPEYVMSLNGTHCLPLASFVGDSCEHDKQCQFLVNTGCFEGICRCKSREYTQINQMECQKNCSSDDECGPNFDCLSGFCECRLNKVKIGNKCCNKIESLGASCNESAHDVCWLETRGEDSRVQCEDGKCVCRPNFKRHHDGCDDIPQKITD